MGGSDLPDLEAEFTSEPFVRGIVGMARSQNPNSANSQFFIMLEDSPHLNNQYTVWGKVLKGMDIVDKIKKVINWIMEKLTPRFHKDTKKCLDIFFLKKFL